MPRFWLTRLAPGLLCTGLATIVSGVDGIVLIDQNRALAGNVTPGDAPGFPVSLTQPGSYRLSGNLTVPSADVSAIEVRTDGVTIDLNGFSIIGPGTAGAGKGIVAVFFPAPGNFSGTTVVNGTVRGMGSDGIRLGGFSRVENVRAAENKGAGIIIANGSLVIGNIVNSNLGGGISAQSASTVRANSAAFNSATGIFVGCPSSVVGNSADQNSFGDISTPNFGTPCTRDQNFPAP